MNGTQKLARRSTDRFRRCGTRSRVCSFLDRIPPNAGCLSLRAVFSCIVPIFVAYLASHSEGSVAFSVAPSVIFAFQNFSVRDHAKPRRAAVHVHSICSESVGLVDVLVALLAQAWRSRDRVRGTSYVPFRLATRKPLERRMECHCDAKRLGDRVLGLLTLEDPVPPDQLTLSLDGM
jgi:hypothetical protein